MSQFILSDSNFNDTAATGCHVLRDFFTSKKTINKKNILPLGILSESFKDTTIFLFDNYFLSTLYPEGLVTETLILLPVEKFQSMREEFAFIVQNKNNSKEEYQLINKSILWAASLTNSLVKNLELKLKINFTEEESHILLTDILSNFNNFNTYPHPLENINIFNEYDLKLPVVKNIDLFNSLENEDLLIVPVLKKMIDSFEERKTSFTKWLSKYPELYSKLPTIAKVIDSFVFEENKDFNLTDMHQNMTAYWQHDCSIFKPLMQMAQLIENIKDNSHNDFDILLSNLKKDLFPYLFNSNYFLFDCSLNYLRDSIFPSSFLAPKENIEKFCNESYEFYNEYQRRSIIHRMTYFDTLDVLPFEDNKEILSKKIKEKKAIDLGKKLPPKNNLTQKVKI